MVGDSKDAKLLVLGAREASRAREAAGRPGRSLLSQSRLLPSGQGQHGPAHRGERQPHR
jgi:hypothetical protein